jgi:hypothetical protein
MSEVGAQMVPSMETTHGQLAAMFDHPEKSPFNTESSSPQAERVQDATQEMFQQLGEAPSARQAPPSISAAALTVPHTWCHTVHEIYACVVRVLEGIATKIGEAIDEAVELPRKLLDRIQQGLETLKPLARDVADRLCQIAVPTFKILIAAGLFAAQSTLFTIGFLTGILKPEAIQHATARICEVWQRQPCHAYGLIIGGAVVAWPIALATSAFFVGANVGVCCQSTHANSTTAPSTEDERP